ncbi:MAG: hypothetical protein COU10_03590 [Candidatus Harrisonbacteria bacterium CG10_big_fil_rev_8_21_14_0_10_45_28]|uniref:Uncharacterized protein n=1 Tax=Candidatus Harrisonbacteria bacterium CG10_big_fil_rev_8_21_14_0_10_45_28 TaxID=1974586 RepID=A0A2H0UPA7_9BACT|nr:MAG: hypothetical protein COU10_03590 [Candidatus Harrisonbacteria bacterium CG10_big_fil_rev_8_21_14_0_10_45_28]
MYQGRVKKDSLKDEGFLNFATSLKDEGGILVFEVEDEFASSIIIEMSEELRSGANFGVVKSEYQTNVVFPEKVFTFDKSNPEEREKMIKYGGSLSISPKELETL